MGRVALDASVVIGFLDPGDALHGASVEALRGHEGDELLLPASAFAEMMVAPSRAGRAAAERAESALRDLAIRIVPLDEAAAREAASLRAGGSGLRLPDALVIGTARATRCDELVTGDARWAGVDPRVRVLRPE